MSASFYSVVYSLRLGQYSLRLYLMLFLVAEGQQIPDKHDWKGKNESSETGCF